MDKIEKLKKVLKDIERENDKKCQESEFCQKHGFKTQSDILYDQYAYGNQIIRLIKMKVIDESIEV